MAEYKYINVQEKAEGLPDGVTVVRFTNPPLHTITEKGLGELAHFLSGVKRACDAGESTIRVLVFTGGAEATAANVFVRSYDVGELSDTASGNKSDGDGGTSTSGSGEVAANFHAVGLALESMPLITVAAINGLAMGGGCELTLACDFRLMSDSCPGYGLPETSIGILPGGGGTQRLARLLGTAKALDLILHSKLLKPAAALEAGMVHRVFPASSFDASWKAFVADLASRAPVALAASKISIQQGVKMPLEKGLELEAYEFGKTMKSEDARQAMANVAQTHGKTANGRGGKYKGATDPGFAWSSRYPAAKVRSKL